MYGAVLLPQPLSWGECIATETANRGETDQGRKTMRNCLICTKGIVVHFLCVIFTTIHLKWISGRKRVQSLQTL